jgi:glucose-1-phosphate cytidylyltransferase
MLNHGAIRAIHLGEMMKTVILAGGRGTRLSEKTRLIPKPMVPIGDDKPILWHIMKIYSTQGFTDFVVALGYLGNVIREYFERENPLPGCNLEFVDTGLDTNTGGRLKMLKEKGYLNDTFQMTYGDGLARIDLASLVAYHKSHGKLATVTAVRLPRFGVLNLKKESNLNRVESFQEKRLESSPLINGGFMVLDIAALDYVKDDEPFETTPLQKLAEDGQLYAYINEDYWQCMDNLHDHELLEQEWATGKAKWKIW